MANNVGVEVPAENEEVQSDAKDSQLTLEKFDIPLKGHSVAVLVNGDISAETLKSYAQVFVNNDLNYAFVGQTAKTLMMTKLVLLKLIAQQVQQYLIV